MDWILVLIRSWNFAQSHFLVLSPVGFVMVKARAEASKFYLWRFMIDQNHQGLGLGRSAI